MKFFDRVKQQTSSSGSGALTLDTSLTGFRQFASVFTSTDRFTYVIQNAATGEWEIGIGSLAVNVLTRETPLYSSGALPLPFGAGVKDVFVAHPGFLSEASHVSVFGTGRDGDVVITGTTVLTQNVDYRNLTLGPTGTLVTAGFRVRVSGICDLSGSKTLSIIAPGSPGGAGAAAVTGGSASVLATAVTVGGAQQGSNGGTGTATNGGNATSPVAFTRSNGGTTRLSGSGGAGAGGTGGAGDTGFGVTGFTRYGIEPLVRSNGGALVYIQGGAGGVGGGAGGGDGGTQGPGGGAGGNGAGVLDLAFAVLKVSPTAPAAVIAAIGGDGGVGGTPGGGNRGGGGGGSGGGGGYCHLVVGVVIGGPDADLISCAGGAGGNGGSKTGTGVVGGGGRGSDGGTIHVINLGAGTTSEVIGSLGGATAGQLGGAGGACTGGV